MSLKRIIFPKNSRSRVMLIVALTVGLFIFGIFCFDCLSSRNVEMKSAEIHVNNLTQVLEEELLSSFKRIDLALLYLQDEIDSEKKITKSREMNQLLKLHLKRLPEVLSLKIVDDKGDYIADDSGIISPLNLRDREYFQYLKNSKKDELVISKPVISKTANKWVMVFARPILTSAGKFKGLVLATIPISDLIKTFSSVDLGKHGSLTLFHQDKTIYARVPNPEKYTGVKTKISATTLEFFNSSLDHSTYRNLSNIDGVDRIISAHRLEQLPLVIVAGLSTDEFLYPWKKRTAVYIFIVLGLMISFTFFLLNFLRSTEELEEQRKQAMQSAKLSSLGEMASGIAHEINNPLAIISSTAYTMRKSNPVSDEDMKHNKKVEKIISTVDRMAKIVRGLKHFSRDSYNDPMTLAEADAIINSALELSAEKMKVHGVEVELRLNSTSPVLCHETQIVQVLMNLFCNSVDALEGVSQKKIIITTEQLNSTVRIKVSDSGPNIPLEIADKVMQPFFTTKGVGKGTGLGLSISKGIVDLHKGQLYHDRTNSMTTFIVELPSAIVTKKAA